MQGNGERPLAAEEREFFRRLYEAHYRALYDYTYQLGVGKDTAEDYVQDAFLVALRRIEDIRKSENPRGYLYQVLKNVIGYRFRSLRYAINLQKRLQEDGERSREASRGDELPPETLYRGAIGDGELELLIRFYLEGWPQKALAAEMGISVNAVQKRIARAKEHLRRALEDPGPPGPDKPPDPGGIREERRRKRG